MIRPILRKELQEHGVALGLLGLCLAALLGLLLVGARFGRAERSALDGLRGFVILASLLGAAALGQMLVAREYTGRTQLFLETLPVGRTRVLAVKLLLGLSMLLTVITVAVAACAAMALRSEAIGSGFALALWVRSVSFALLLHAFFFAFSLLGRYRVPCLVLGFLAFGFVVASKEIDLVQSGPLALVGPTFAAERHGLPWPDLAWAWGGAAGLLAAGFALGLTREGAVSAMLAESMSQREKAFIGLLAIATTLAMATLEERREKKPFDLKDAHSVEGDGVRVKLSPAGQPGGPALADRTHGELVRLRQFLGASSLPPVFLTTRRDLDDRRYERGEVGEAEGLLVRIHYPSPGWSEPHFTAWLAREVVAAHSRERARIEGRRWVLDGVGLYWTRRELAGQPLSSAPDLTLRALYGTTGGLSGDRLTRWLTFRERVGDDVASAVAWSGLQTLARHAGPERVHGLLQSLLGRRPTGDFRAAWEDWRSPLPVRLAAETGWGYETFLDRWRRDLEAERAARRAELAGVPVLAGSPVVSGLSESTRAVSYELRASPPPPPGTEVHLRHLDLPLFDAEIEPEALRSEDRFWPLAAAVDLPGTYARGARVAWTFALFSDALGCEVISGWTRQRVP